MPNLKVPVAALSLRFSAQQYLYHRSSWSLAGTPVPEGTVLGTLVLTVEAVRSSVFVGGALPVAIRPLVGPTACFYEIKIPTYEALKVLVGDSGINNARVAIAAFVRPDVAARRLTFTHTTALSVLI